MAETERVRSAASPLRCPFCHDGIDVQTEAWRACRECLARHHAPCWDEGGACGACGSPQFLTDPGAVEAAPRPRRALEPPPRAPDSQAMADLLLSPFTLGLYPTQSVEARLRDDIDAAGLDDAQRTALTHASRQRSRMALMLFLGCALTALGGSALADFWRHGHTVQRDVGTIIALGAGLTWPIGLLVLLRHHWAAVRELWTRAGVTPLPPNWRSDWVGMFTAALLSTCAGPLGFLVLGAALRHPLTRYRREARPLRERPPSPKDEG